MPKKKAGWHDAESLANIAQRLAVVRDRLLSLREELGERRLPVLGHPGLLRGLELVEHFADQGHRAFQDALTEEGKFESQ